uniref:Cytidylate kinase n=1 Tax=candidate division WOR-3 bacterium TaxID=2052148 RepID=A0A7C4TBK1_UNCW3
MEGFVVAIDGNAGSGKSTTAKGIAQRLKFFYLDTGAMYRAFTLKYLNNGGNEKIDLDLVRKLLKDTTIELNLDGENLVVKLDGQDVSQEIRTPRVNALVSQISAIKEVRDWMVKRQREIARGKNIVCEGRDMTTVVFPDAQVKIFMDADLRTRAKRRQKELKEKGIKAKLREVIKNLKFRDTFDSHREYSPLRKAKDAVVIDTTNLTIDEEIARVVEVVLQKLNKTNLYKESL